MARDYICYLTTIDNPFDPSKDFDQWFVWDATHDYNTCGKLARVAKTSEDLFDVENAEAIEQAIDDIIAVDFRGIYMKVKVPV